VRRVVRSRHVAEVRAPVLAAHRYRPVALTFVGSFAVVFAALAWVLPSNGPSSMPVAALMAGAYASLAAAMSALAVGWSSLTGHPRVDPALEKQLSRAVLGRDRQRFGAPDGLAAARYALSVSESQPVMALLLGGFLAANAFLQAAMLVGSSNGDGAAVGFNAVLLCCFVLVAAIVLPVLVTQTVRARRYLADHEHEARTVLAEAGN
jgi:hypothetical protein